MLVGGEIMVEKKTYLHLLIYHVVLFVLPTIAVVLVFFNQVNNVFYGIYSFYRWRIADDPNQTLAMIAMVIKLLFKLISVGFIVAVVVQIFQTGLHFIPHLAMRNKLSGWRILGLGIRKYIPVFIITAIGMILISIVNSVLLVIPIINLLSFLILPYCLAVFSIFKDFMFSQNMDQGKPLFSQPAQHFTNLFIENKQFLLYAGILALSYYFLYIASVFVKPYIQVKIIELMQNSDPKQRQNHISNSVTTNSI